MSRPGVLITRPEPGLSETMAAVSALGFEGVACPLLQIRALPCRLPPSRALDAILLTSSQAVAPLAEAAIADPGLHGLALFAVGDATAARARALGFGRTLSAAGAALDLAALVRATLPPPARLLLATTSGQGDALAADLRAQCYRLHRRLVYAVRPAKHLPRAAEAALGAGGIEACLFFSGEVARNFARRCPVTLLPSLSCVRALVISTAVRSLVEQLDWKSVHVAPHPDAASLLSLLRSPP